MLPSKDQWNKMIDACKNVLGTENNYLDLRDGFSRVGGYNLQSYYYWSSTESEYEDESSLAWLYDFGNDSDSGNWYRGEKDSNSNSNIWVRACLAF